MGQHRERKAENLIAELEKKGFQAKIHAPLPEHKTSGHIHITVLSDLRDLLELGGIVECKYGMVCAKHPDCPNDFKHGNRTRDYSCLEFLKKPRSPEEAMVHRKKTIYQGNMRDEATVLKALTSLRESKS